MQQPDGHPMSHDQNFKNLILDYPRAAIAFFAAIEAQAIDAGARLLPIREEQLKARLGERFRPVDPAIKLTDTPLPWLHAPAFRR